LDCEQSGVHAPAICSNGVCERNGPCEQEWGDCTDEPGCETSLTTPEHCGACGRDDCGAANATPDCSSTSGCVPPTCNAGFGNCDRTSLDCESAFGAACFPRYLGTRRVVWDAASASVDDEGSVYIAGGFYGELDFDTSSGVDLHVPRGYNDAFVTRLDPSGAYAWTRTFGGPGGYVSIAASAVAPDGTVVVSGYFSGTIDADPGAGTDAHTAAIEGSSLVTKLTPDGALVWARDLPGESNITKLALDASGSIYAIGTFWHEIDLDPGPGSSEHRGDAKYPGTFLVKLDADGNFVWDAVIDGTGYREWTGLAVASDGILWTTAFQAGSATLLGRSLEYESNLVVASFFVTGGIRTLWSPGPAPDGLMGDVAATSHVHVVGSMLESMDLDPGPATITRIRSGSGIGVTLDPAGNYVNARVFPSEPLGIVSTPDGGSLVSILAESDGQLSFELRAFYPDGTSSWTLPLPTSTSHSLAASPTHFIVMGHDEVGGDFDPGPATDEVSGPAAFVTLYAF
jgi:hypothetical protein